MKNAILKELEDVQETAAGLRAVLDKADNLPPLTTAESLVEVVKINARLRRLTGKIAKARK
jgi:hypothetical protein